MLSFNILKLFQQKQKIKIEKIGFTKEEFM